MSLVIDSSAIIAVFFGEPEEALFMQAIADSRGPVVSAVSYMDAARQMLARNSEALGMLEDWTAALDITVSPMTPQIALQAARAGRELAGGRLLDARNMPVAVSLALAREQHYALLAKNRLLEGLPELWQDTSKTGT